MVTGNRPTSTDIIWEINLDNNGDAQHNVEIMVSPGDEPPTVALPLSIKFGAPDIINTVVASVNGGIFYNFDSSTTELNGPHCISCSLHNIVQTATTTPHNGDKSIIKLCYSFNQPRSLQQANGFFLATFGYDCTLLYAKSIKLTINFPVVGLVEYLRRSMFIKLKREKGTLFVGIFKVHHFEDSRTVTPRSDKKRKACLIYDATGKFPIAQFLFVKGGNFLIFPMVIWVATLLFSFVLGVIASWTACQEPVSGILGDFFKFIKGSG